jgi:hypothetical protein
MCSRHDIAVISIIRAKQGTFRVFKGFDHLQTSETSGRKMTVELDSRHPLLPKVGWGK